MAEWDRIVEDNNGSVFLKESYISVLESTYNYKIYRLKSDNGVFPLALQKSAIFGNRMVSLPFADYGGACGNAKELVQQAVRIGEELNVDFIELRSPAQQELFKGFEKREDYCTFIINLLNDEGTLWKSMEKRVRNDINKALRSNIDIRTGSREDMPAFFRIYLNTMKRLGSPPHSIRFFNNLWEKMPENMRLMLASHEAKTIAAQIFYTTKEKIYYAYNCALPEYRTLRATDLMLWETIKLAKQQGIKEFDFGRTRFGSGVYFSKKSWGGEERKMPYYYKFIRKRIGQRQEESYEWASKLWAKLMPGFMAKRAGPWIIKQVG